VSKKDKLNSLLEGRTSSTPSAGGTAAKEEIVTGIQESVNTVPKKKATFEMNLELHTKLKVFAANKGKPMVDVIEEALRWYLNDQ
jgi:hypothetical protein